MGLLEEDDYEEADETTDDVRAEEFDEPEYEDLLDDKEPVGYENATVHPEVTHKADLPKASPLTVRNEIRKGEPLVTGPLNWFEEEAEVEKLPGPDFITYGCWLRFSMRRIIKKSYIISRLKTIIPGHGMELKKK